MADTQPSTTLFVGGLSYSTTAAELTEYFTKFATVAYASIANHSKSSRGSTCQSRGFGYVSLATADEALLARVVGGSHVIKERLATVQRARDDKFKPDFKRYCVPRRRVKELRPGVVLIKHFLSLTEQQSLVALCAEMGRRPAGFYTPSFRRAAATSPTSSRALQPSGAALRRGPLAWVRAAAIVAAARAAGLDGLACDIATVDAALHSMREVAATATARDAASGAVHQRQNVGNGSESRASGIAAASTAAAAIAAPPAERRMRLRIMCLGRHWNPRTHCYSQRRMDADGPLWSGLSFSVEHRAAKSVHSTFPELTETAIIVWVGRGISRGGAAIVRPALCSNARDIAHHTFSPCVAMRLRT